MLVNWSGFLTVIQQLIQVAVYIALRFPKMVKRMKREQAILRARVESVELSSIDASAQVSRAEQQSLEMDTNDDDIEDLSNKFVVPGGWFGVALVCVPITGLSLFLCVEEGWESLVITIAMVIVMFILKGIEIGIKKLIVKCKRRKARARRERSENQIDSEATP